MSHTFPQMKRILRILFFAREHHDQNEIHPSSFETPWEEAGSLIVFGLPPTDDNPTAFVDIKANFSPTHHSLFGDDAFSKKNDSRGSDLSFNRSSRTAEIPVPTVFEKLFFEKVARLIQYTCDCNPEIPWRHLIGIGLVFIRIFFFQIKCTSDHVCNWVIQSITQIELCTRPFYV